MIFERYIVIRFTAAEPEKVLTKLANEQIDLTNIAWVDALTTDIKIRQNQLLTVQRFFDCQEIHYKIVRREGVLWYLLNFCRRPVLFWGLFVFAMIVLLLPGRILFVELSGNDTVLNTELMHHVEDCGICFGMKASDIRSEVIKNTLIGKIPKLQWVGVTTSGCVIKIQVKERSTPADDYRKDGAVSSVVASYDGLITEMTVYRGNPLFQVGQSVKMGDVLISGYTDCGIKTIAQQAGGEVFAYTRRQYNAVTPAICIRRGKSIDEHICFRLQIGKKVINLCNHSGIPGTTCVKMYSEYYWPFPGRFRLPISLIKVAITNYELSCEQLTNASVGWLPQYIRAYSSSQMIAGRILKESVVWKSAGDLYEICGKYACHEMIGQEKYEEIFEQDAKND